MHLANVCSEAGRVVMRVEASTVDLNLMVVFDAIYAEGSVTRAAQALHLSQPAVSHALARLRRVFDDPLFERHGRTMVATPVAHRAIEPVRQALELIEVSLAGVDRFDPATAERGFAIGVLDNLEPLALAPITAKLSRLAPGVSLNFVRVNRRQIGRDLAIGDLDLAIDVLLPLDESIRRQPIHSAPLVVAANLDHPRIGAGLDLATYLAEEHIQVSGRRTGMSIEDFELSRQGIERRIRVRCQNHLAAWQTARATELLLTIAEPYARSFQRFADAIVRPCPLPVATMDWYLYWHANRDTDPANRWMRAQLAESMFATA